MKLKVQAMNHLLEHEIRYELKGWIMTTIWCLFIMILQCIGIGVIIVFGNSDYPGWSGDYPMIIVLTPILITTLVLFLLSLNTTYFYYKRLKTLSAIIFKREE